MSPEELVCATEIAYRLGVNPSAVTNWRNRPQVDFPAPWGIWPSGPLWVWVEVAAWHEDRVTKREAARARTVTILERRLARLKVAR